MGNWEKAALLALLVIVIIVPGTLFKKTKRAQNISEPYTFTGSHSCIECHQNEYSSWEKSHHRHAMAIATDSSVLGDFKNVYYNDGTRTHRFFKENGKFYVNTLGPNGKMSDFEITHTFGYVPLQQYLIPFENGKFQCLHIAWDTEKKKWFNMSKMVYSEDIHHHDWLHWTNQAQNWNGMCAECHSTNLNKNYYHLIDSFATSYSEISVGCEACHGPASEHVKWAQLPVSARWADTTMGLMVKTNSINTEQQVNLCMRCHSRRGQFADFKHEYGHIYDYLTTSVLDENWYPDGQILDEDYVYHSFIQSKMYDAGVKCSDCHDVHSGERYFEGNRLCYQCHTQDYYGTNRHHFHKDYGEPGEPLRIDSKVVNVGEGAQCVNCHMPAKYYMGIDLRNDHSLRVPRPDLSEKTRSPNACNQCHTDKAITWATEHFTQWYGKKRKPHYGETIALAREQKPEAEHLLIQLVNNELNPLVVRATGIELLGGYYSDTAQLTLIGYLDSPLPELRQSAIKVFNGNTLDDYLRYVTPLLKDPYRAIRSQAAIKLSVVPLKQIPQKYHADFQNALKEFKENNEYMADFTSGRMNLGIMYGNVGDYGKAKINYQKAISTDSAFIPAKVNLALVHNALGENKEAISIYENIVQKNPEFEAVYFSLGLLFAEEKQYEKSVKYLELAAERTPGDDRVFYNLGLIYQQLNEHEKALVKLKQAHSLKNENFDYLYALCFYHANIEDYQTAYEYGKALKKLYPKNQQSNQLIGHIVKMMHDNPG